MTPFQTALEMFQSQGIDRAEAMEILAQFLEAGGCIYAGPDCFGMARQVSTSWPPEVMADPALENEGLTGDLDCWHISFASGDLQALLEKLPHPLPCLSFERRGQTLRVRNLTRFIRHGQFVQVTGDPESAEAGPTG